MPEVIDRDMDAPEPEKNFAAYLRAVERYVVETAEPVLTYEQILDAADVERSARFTEFALQKNYEMVDFIIEGQPRIDPMMSGKKMNRLEYTQTLTKKTHPMEVTDD